MLSVLFLFVLSCSIPRQIRKERININLKNEDDFFNFDCFPELGIHAYLKHELDKTKYDFIGSNSKFGVKYSQLNEAIRETEKTYEELKIQIKSDPDNLDLFEAINKIKESLAQLASERKRYEEYEAKVNAFITKTKQKIEETVSDISNIKKTNQLLEKAGQLVEINEELLYRAELVLYETTIDLGHRIDTMKEDLVLHLQSAEINLDSICIRQRNLVEKKQTLRKIAPPSSYEEKDAHFQLV